MVQCSSPSSTSTWCRGLSVLVWRTVTKCRRKRHTVTHFCHTHWSQPLLLFLCWHQECPHKHLESLADGKSRERLPFMSGERTEEKTGIKVEDMRWMPAERAGDGPTQRAELSHENCCSQENFSWTSASHSNNGGLWILTHTARRPDIAFMWNAQTEPQKHGAAPLMIQSWTTSTEQSRQKHRQLALSSFLEHKQGLFKKQLLWKLASQNNPTELYFYATIHEETPASPPLPPREAGTKRMERFHLRCI